MYLDWHKKSSTLIKKLLLLWGKYLAFILKVSARLRRGFVCNGLVRYS